MISEVRFAAFQPRAGEDVGNLVQELAGHESAEGEGRAADQYVDQVPDLLVLGDELQFTHAQFPGRVHEPVGGGSGAPSRKLMTSSARVP